MSDLFDLEYLDNYFKEGDVKISGPWRLTVWKKANSPPCYLFSEEHANEGSCPEEKDISIVSRELLNNTENVHVFIEHFIHALEVSNVKLTEKEACSSKSKAILNNMRNCLEVVRVNNPVFKKRIHFIDPRMDIVSVLPDGKLFEAITHYAEHLVSQNDIGGALMTLYEAFIHPLLSVVPDKFGVKGRMTGVMEKFRDGMTDTQRTFFESKWNTDIIQRVKKLSKMYVQMQKSSSIDNMENLKLEYTGMVNKFMDMWLLAQFFVSQNGGMTGALVYAGSLHSLNFESYLKDFGYSRTKLRENKSLAACLML